jgi:hypothetical protein
MHDALLRLVRPADCISMCMRAAMILAWILCSVSMAPAVVSPGRHPYRKHWKQTIVGKRPVAGVVAGAGVKTLRHGGGAAGLGKNVGTGFATHAVKTTVEHAIAGPLHEDLHYHRSTKSGFGPRMQHALVSTVVTSNTKTGKRTPAAGRVAGHAAAGAVSQVAIAGASGASTAGIGLGAEAGANVAREFWPRRRTTRERVASP